MIGDKTQSIKCSNYNNNLIMEYEENGDNDSLSDSELDILGKFKEILVKPYCYRKYLKRILAIFMTGKLTVFATVTLATDSLPPSEVRG